MRSYRIMLRSLTNYFAVLDPTQSKPGQSCAVLWIILRSLTSIQAGPSQSEKEPQLSASRSDQAPGTIEAVAKMAGDLEKTLGRAQNAGAEKVLDPGAPLQEKVLAGIAGRNAIYARRQLDDLRRHARRQGLHYDNLANKGMVQTNETIQTKPKRTKKRSAGLEM